MSLPEPATAGINVRQVMETIRERARAGEANGKAAALPASPPPATHLPASLSPAVARPELAEVGAMPPIPPTLRGKLGAAAISAVRRLLDWHLEQIRSWFRENLAWRAAASRTVAEQSAALLDLQTRLQHLESETARLRSELEDPAAGAGLRDGPGASHWRWDDASYLEFEKRHRPGLKETRRLLRTYLPRVRECGAGTAARPILDLGSGRGEWLQLLRREGLAARGVDCNRFMVEHCGRRGLDVAHGDALSHLRSTPSRSCGLVSALQVIEHLPAEVLFAVLDEVSRVLKPGGVVLLETPNPENILVAAHDFHMDPTRQRPLPPMLVEFLLKSRGFEEIEILRRRPEAKGKRLRTNGRASQFINDHFFGPRDYAAVGRRI